MRIYVDISNTKFNHLEGAPGLFRPPIILHYDDGTRRWAFGPLEIKNARLIFSENRDERPQVWVEVDPDDVIVEGLVPPR